jgi:ubiquinone/menaquinone biosynthesis C-methylase UbiE
MPTDRDVARAKYRQYAARYDRGSPGSAFVAGVRRELVTKAHLKPGDAVLDVACGKES